jgi:hypothetical protein
MPFLGPSPSPTIGTVPDDFTDNTIFNSIVDPRSLKSDLDGRILTVFGSTTAAEGSIGEQLMKIDLEGEGSESLSIDSKLSLLGQANALGIVAQKYEEGEKQLLERGRVAILHKRQKLNEQIASKLQTVPSDHSEVARLMGSLNPIVHMQVGGMIQRNPHCRHIGNADVIRLVYAISETYLENSQEFHLDDLNLADFLRRARETPASATGTDAAPAPPVVS